MFLGRWTASSVFVALVAAAAPGLPCSVPVGFDLRRPFPGVPVEFDASLVFSGSYRDLGSVTLADAEGSDVAVEVAAFGTPSFHSGLVVVDPVAPLVAGARYRVTLELEAGPGWPSSEFAFDVAVGDRALAPRGSGAGEFEVESYYTDDPAWEESCMRTAAQAISLSLDAPASEAPRLVVARSSQGTSAILLESGGDVDRLLAGIPVAGIDDIVTLEVFGLDGALLGSTTVERPRLCYDLDVAMRQPVPPGGLDLQLNRSQLESAARPCDEEGAPIYEREAEADVGPATDAGSVGEEDSSDAGGVSGADAADVVDATTTIPSGQQEHVGCASARPVAGALWAIGAALVVGRRSRSCLRSPSR